MVGSDRSALIYVGYVIGILISVSGVMLFGWLFGLLVDAVSQTPTQHPGTDEDAVDVRFYGEHYNDEEDY